ncbi:MAG: exonuclease domain-containing protein [Microbacteriaceae bacterium]
MNAEDSTETFVALDVETANRFRGSICEIGLVKFSGSEEVGRFSTLIRPHDDYNEFEYTGIHGISFADVRDAPALDEAWPMIWEFIGSGPFMAHNASFDVGAFFDASGYLGLEIPRTDFYCSLVLSRRILGLPSNRLADLASHFGIAQKAAHRAEDDAFVAGRIICNLLEVTSSSSLAELASKYQIAPGVIGTDLNVGSKLITEFSDHVTSLPRYSPVSRKNTDAEVAETGKAVARDLLLTWVNDVPPEFLNAQGRFHGDEVFFADTCGLFTPWEGQQIVALEGGLSSAKRTKFTSLVVCAESQTLVYETAGIRVITPGEFLALANRQLTDLPTVPKPHRGNSNGAMWIRV